MKKLFFGFACALLVAFSTNVAQAQVNGPSYKTAGGVRVDFGDGITGFGLNVKHFLTSTNALDGSLVFYDGGIVGLGGEFQYNDDINGAQGLKYYAGIGPNFLFGNNSTAVQLRPVLGLDYKINEAPINLAFDWRPMFTMNQGTDFNAGRFGLSVRFAFK